MAQELNTSPMITKGGGNDSAGEDSQSNKTELEKRIDELNSQRNDKSKEVQPALDERVEQHEQST